MLLVDCRRVAEAHWHDEPFVIPKRRVDCSVFHGVRMHASLEEQVGHVDFSVVLMAGAVF